MAPGPMSPASSTSRRPRVRSPQSCDLGTSFLSVDQARRNLELEQGNAGSRARRRGSARSGGRRLGRATGGARGRRRAGRRRGTDHGRLAPVPAEPLPELRARERRHRRRPAMGARQSRCSPPTSTPTPARARSSSRGRSTSTTGSGTPTAPRGRCTRCSIRGWLRELVEGFLQHYREAGWIPRWSSPGFADCMVGTSSDIAFADALVKDVDVDAETAYLGRSPQRHGRDRGHPGRTQVARSGDLPRLDAGRGARGHVVVDRRLHQRLRHRRRWRAGCWTMIVFPTATTARG